MNRNEFLEALPLSHLVLKLTGATLEICTDDIDDVHVMVSGADADVKALSIAVKGNQLVLEQPAMSLQRNPIANGWLQVTLRLPRSWKGQIDARTVSGWITVRGLSGTELTLETVSGLISGTSLFFSDATVRSVTGDVRLGDVAFEKAAIQSTSGVVTAQAASLGRCTLMNITGHTTLELCTPFLAISATSVTGDLSIDAPVGLCCINQRTVAGRIRTSHVLNDETADVTVSFNTVSGNLTLINTNPNA